MITEGERDECYLCHTADACDERVRSGAETPRRSAPKPSAFSPTAVNLGTRSIAARNRDERGSLNCRGAARGASRVTRLFPALSRVAIARSHDLAGMFPAARTGLRRALSRLASARAPSPALDPRARVPSLARVLAAPPIDDRASAVAAVASSRLARAGFRASARGSLSAEEGGASSERADPERGLSRVLGEELEHERTTYTPSDVVTKGPPEPFEIIESDGDCEVTLTRAYGDDEEIAITFNATEDPYDEDDAILPAGADEGDEDEDEEVAIHFLVSVSRGDGEEALEFSRQHSTT